VPTVPKNSFSRGLFSNRRQHAHLHSTAPHLRLIINFLHSFSQNIGQHNSNSRAIIMSSPESKSSISCGPWKLFRFVLRVAFFGVIAWIILALLWAFLPSPLRDPNPDNGSLYATSQLRAGKTLTRVYEYAESIALLYSKANTLVLLVPSTFASKTTIDQASQLITSWIWTTLRSQLVVLSASSQYSCPYSTMTRWRRVSRSR